MRIVKYSETGHRKTEERTTVLTAGMFDGVHKGHQRIIADVVARASAAGLASAVLTLDRHPSGVVDPHRRVELLTSTDRKLELISELGIDTAFVIDFSVEVAAMAADAFIENVVADWCGAAEVVVGHDFKFGYKRTGDETLMRRMGDRLGFAVRHFPPVLIDGTRVSSTLVREYVLAGRLGDAWRFLGRPYTLDGKVIRGKGIGRELGFPTVNIVPHNRVMPPDGVYAACVKLPTGAEMPAAVNIGLRPTIEPDDGVARSVEAFILDFDDDLYGRNVEMALWQFIRPERKFPTIEELREHIADDVEEVRRLTSGDMPYEARPPEPRRHAKPTGG